MGLIYFRTCMAATGISSSPNSEFHRLRHSRHLFHLIPSLTHLFLFLTAAVLGSPSMAASEPQRCLIQHSSNNPPQKQKSESESSGRWRRDDRRFESAAIQVPSGPETISNNPPRKRMLESESRGRQRRDDRPFESAPLEVPNGTNRVSNNPPRKQTSHSESGGQRRRYDSQFESAGHEVPSGPNPISN